MSWKGEGGSPEGNFWVKVQKTDTCWLWTGALDKGYGKFWFKQKIMQAHRVSWFLANGSFPSLPLDHLCRNRACVNPAHLEPVTNKVNVLRGVGFAAQNAKKSCCKYGHPFSAENTYSYPARNMRQCRTCNRIRDRKKYEKRLANRAHP